MPQRADRTTRVVVFAAVAWALAWCALQALAVPFGYGPDEPSHAAYAGLLARTGRLPGPDDVALQAQHPPLYYAALGAAASLRPDLTAEGRSAEPSPGVEPFLPGPPLATIPLGRPVALAPAGVVRDPFGPSGPDAGLAAGEDPLRDRRYTSLRALYLLRLVGVACFALTALALWIAARNAGAALAVAAVVATPQLGATFASLNSDHFAVMFGAAAFAALVARPDRPLHATGRVSLAGALLAAALASKLFAVGAAAACAVYLIAADEVPARVRLRSLLLLAAPSVLAVGPWAIRQWRLYGGIDPATVSGARALGMVKLSTPDAAWSVDFIGRLPGLWFASAGAEQSDAGALLGVAAAAFPLVAVVGGVVAAARRDTPRRTRAACFAFLVAGALQTIAVVAANQRFNSPQGRYLQVLCAPGALALAAGADALFRDRARAATLALCGLSMFATATMVYGRRLPAFHAAADGAPAADVVDRTDPALEQDAPRAIEGLPATWRETFDGRARAFFGAGRAAVRTRPLTPGAAYVASVRLRPPREAGALIVVAVDDAPPVGPFSPELLDAPVRIPFVAGPAAAVGALVTASDVLGGPTALGAVEILRAPFAPAVAMGDDGALHVRLRPTGAAGDAPEAVALDGDLAAPAPLAVGGAGERLARLRAPSATQDDLVLRFFEAPRPVAVFKLLRILGPEAARRVRGDLSVPGLRTVALPADPIAEPIAVLAQGAGVVVPAGEGSWELQDARGRTIPVGAAAWRLPDGRTLDAAEASFDTPRAPGPFATLIQTSGPLEVDRVVRRATPTWTLRVPDPRRAQPR
ncbi:MAG TPA: hypothetical protein VEI02_02470 [Planctomycetota bacterium]|nr:hypothetical protein [Planctomycetota bacterium]